MVPSYTDKLFPAQTTAILLKVALDHVWGAGAARCSDSLCAVLAAPHTARNADMDPPPPQSVSLLSPHKCFHEGNHKAETQINWQTAGRHRGQLTRPVRGLLLKHHVLIWGGESWGYSPERDFRAVMWLFPLQPLIRAPLSTPAAQTNQLSRSATAF